MRCAKCGYTIVGFARREHNRYYQCNGHRKKDNDCDMPAFRAELVDSAVWNWLKDLMQHPEKVAAGLRGSQAEADRTHSALRERLSLIESRKTDIEKQRAKLLDLYLSDEFDKEVLTERKLNLDKSHADLEQERIEVAALLDEATLSEEQIVLIEAYCAEVREGIEGATFEDKRMYFDLLDVRVKLAVENNEKVAYIQCKLGKQRLSLVQTSRLSSIGAITTPACACL